MVRERGKVMTRFEELKNMDIETLVEWLDENGQFDGSPWCEWFDENYCKKCEPIKCKYSDTKKHLGFESFYEADISCAYCELEGRCKFFPELDETPSCKDIVKMWLESEIQ